MLSEVVLHRENFYDWGGPEWIYDDNRLNLSDCADEKLLEFLAFMLHPRVRPDQQEVDRILAIINPIIERDGYTLAVAQEVSGKRIFSANKLVGEHIGHTDEASRIADQMSSSHVRRQVDRMKNAVMLDPALAIGSAKEFVESIAKGVLYSQSIDLSGSETLPQLVKMTRDNLNLSITPETDAILKRVLSGLATITQGIAELRGRLGTGHGDYPDVDLPPVEVAQLAVGMATTLGVFLYQMSQSMQHTAIPIAKINEKASSALDDDEFPF